MRNTLDDLLSKATREELLRAARHLGPEAEDAVQEATLAAISRSPVNPVEYAFGALRNLTKGRRQADRARWVEEEPTAVAPEVVFETAADVARLDASMEQVLAWGGWGGTTTLLVDSLLDYEVAATLRELRAVLAVFPELPVSARHRRRLHSTFEGELISALSHCSYKYGSRSRTPRVVLELPEAIEPRIEADPCDEGDVPVDTGRTAAVVGFRDGAAQRAFLTAVRYARRLPVRDALEIAGRAVALADAVES